MTITEQVIRGLEVADELTHKSKRQVCKDAGVSVLTYRRFMQQKTDILLVNLDKICGGYGMTINKVIALGEK